MPNFGVIIGTVSLAIASLFGQHQYTHLINTSPPTIVLHKTIQQNTIDTKTVTAQGQLTQFGQTVFFSFTYPETGGDLRGSIHGACTGTISGIYQNKQINGHAQAQCQVLIATIQGTADFHGTVSSSSQATLYAKVFAQGQSREFTLPITLSQ